MSNPSLGQCGRLCFDGTCGALRQHSIFLTAGLTSDPGASVFGSFVRVSA